MRRFLILGMYTGGIHAGQRFLLAKGRYLVGRSGPRLIDTYAFEITARAVADRYNRQNRADLKKKRRVTPCVYKPYEIIV